MILALSTAYADVTVSFTNSTVNASQIQPVTLKFSVNGSGVVSLDASTGSTNAANIAVVDAWDTANAGTVASPDLYNSTFTLVASGSNANGGTPPLHCWTNNGGVLGVGGHNSGRIDGGGLVPPNVETMRWTAITEAAIIEFKSVAYNNSVNGTGMIISAPGVSTTQSIDSTPGSVDLTGTGDVFLLDNATSIDFTTNGSGGYSLTGFTISITPKFTQSVGLDLTN